MPSKFLQYVENQQGIGREHVKVSYDQETDTITITLREERVKESDEVRPGVIADFGDDGGIVRFEILGASKVVTQHAGDAIRDWRIDWMFIAASPNRAG
jgi:uncharacterized protein YuzE